MLVVCTLVGNSRLIMKKMKADNFDVTQARKK